MLIGCASRAKPGEKECGDGYVIANSGHCVVIAVVDGLGHGPAAAHSAQIACNFIRDNAGHEIVNVITECSAALYASRGAALTVLRIDTLRHEMCYAGIGNVDIRALSRRPIRPVNYPGIVGRKIRKVVSTIHKLSDGDILVLFTDGVSSRFNIEEYRNADAQTIADRIIAEHGKDHDDATCVAIRY